MNITAQDLIEFKKIYKDRFGINIDDNSARSKLNTLVFQVAYVFRVDQDLEQSIPVQKNMNQQNDNERRASKTDK